MSKIRTVIIEDHHLTRLGICTALRQKDEIEVVGEAINARHGLIILKQLQPDIAIVDIGLPDQDGIELTRKIKAIRPLRNTKVLILTLSNDKESVLTAFSAGADSYCMKDIEFDNLLEAIGVTAAGNPWIDPMIARIILEQVQEKTSVESNNHQRSIKPGILTARELEVLQLIAGGCSNAKIAKKLYITTGTVKTHVGNIMNKLCAKDRTEAAVIALRSGLVP
ncbi:response regulator transcription factor [Dolichospermum sp. ST_con]|nr:response regulator transcription factor [Dolichospermum sp. ST_con]MDD1422247.1 response regulator transcription factor [Dolichospermum sp. ST_sed1]MDD1423806.1 response regulator transcription factor [Dolichospermum sp. ST_sed9]MDD1432756.1 response regulator transcription factor [Dolichospermum sp. ST_sed6]MDD1438401.1 response regulator transcription factor [Dolichospermum sp. ST_sed10]MDD1441063.1 response regulator transcription factor [Dolichospermum sp. ST_sed3]MDD1444838.1 response